MASGDTEASDQVTNVRDSGDDDFEEARTCMRINVGRAIRGLEALESFHHSRTSRTRKHGSKRKRGPAPKVVTNHWYCLPAGATLPNLKKWKTCPIFKAHKEAGYGYPPSLCNDETETFGKVTLPINISKEEYHEKIWDLFPALSRRPFQIFKRDKQGTLVPLKNPNHPIKIKDDKYRSVVLVRAVASFEEDNESRNVAVEGSGATESMPTAVEVTARGADRVESDPTRGRTGVTGSTPSAAVTPVDASNLFTPLSSSGEIQRRRILRQPEHVPSEQEIQTSSAEDQYGIEELDDIDDLPTMFPLRSRRQTDTTHIANLYRTEQERETDDDGVEDEDLPDMQQLLQSRSTSTVSDRAVLRMEQDMAFHASLQADQERDADRRQELELRERMRHLHEEEMKKKLEEIGPEPTDGIKIVFRLPDGRRVTRRFNEDSHLNILFLYVEGKFGYKEIKLLSPTRNVIMRCMETSIKEDISDNSIVTVEGEPAVDDTPCNGDSVVESQADDGNSSEEIDMESRRKIAREYLCYQKQITVDRGDILNSVLTAYRADLELEHHHLKVKIKGEIAVDIDGVTKEMFQLFFSAFAEKHLCGHLQKTPDSDHRYHTTDLYRTLGRIVCHAYVLCGYWPIQINKATMIAALTTKVSEEVVLKSFLDVVYDEERKVLQALLDGEGTARDRLQTLGVLTRFDCRQNITNDNARSVLTSLAYSVCIFRPYHAVMQIGQGLRAYQNLWNGVQENTILNIINNAIPLPSKIIALMTPIWSEEPDQRTMEERVVLFLEAWVAGLSPSRLATFLVFWTASNVLLPGQILKVEFNSLEGLARRPTSVTCTDTLQLSRMYISDKDFDEDMSVVFSEDAKVMDAL